MLRTGWSKFFDQPDKFLGNFEGQSKQVFPGEEKVVLLYRYKVKASPHSSTHTKHKHGTFQKTKSY